MVPMCRSVGVETTSAACATAAYLARTSGWRATASSDAPAPIVRPPSFAMRISASSLIARERDDGGRRLLAALHVRPEVGAAGHVARVVARVGARAHGLGHGARLHQREARQTQH